MKKNFLFANVLIICALLLQGCAISVNTTKHNEQPWIGNPFDMARTDYRIVKEINAQTKATYVLGIGGWKSRKDNAVEMLLKSVDLKHNQQLVNITHNTFINVIVCGIVVRKVTTAHGYIIETGVAESITPTYTPDVQETHSTQEKVIPTSMSKNQSTKKKKAIPTSTPKNQSTKQNSIPKEYSKCIKQATNMYDQYWSYYGSARHVSAFYNVIKNTKQNPTDENIADLKCCMMLIGQFSNGSQSPDALEKKLKSTKDKDEQMKIFIEEAKQSNK